MGKNPIILALLGIGREMLRKLKLTRLSLGMDVGEGRIWSNWNDTQVSLWVDVFYCHGEYMRRRA
jgi:hypothetical protein